MKKFIKENFVLILGLTLPLLLIFIFWLAGEIARMRTAPPTYAVVFLTQYYPYPENRFHADVVQDTLQLKYRDFKHDHYPRPSPRLYMFDPVQGTCTEYTYDIPDVTDDKWHVLSIPEFEHIRLDKRQISPEGFVLERRQNNSLGLFSMFSYRHKSGFVLSKKGYHMPIPQVESDYYASPHFIGWVKP